MSKQQVLIDYTNHRGERAVRTIQPRAIAFDMTEWHPDQQWLLEAYDVEKGAGRTFAMKDIHRWGLHPDKQMGIDLSLARQLQRSMERNARMAARLTKLSQKMMAHADPEMQDAGGDIATILKDEDPA